MHGLTSPSLGLVSGNSCSCYLMLKAGIAGCKLILGTADFIPTTDETKTILTMKTCATCGWMPHGFLMNIFDLFGAST